MHINKDDQVALHLDPLLKSHCRTYYYKFATVVTGISAYIHSYNGNILSNRQGRLQWLVHLLVQDQCPIFTHTSLSLTNNYYLICSKWRIWALTYLFFSTSLNNLSATCNSACDCGSLQYAPICSVDNTRYFSPCHAGCTHAREVDGGTVNSLIIITLPEIKS